jgi:hypothetical protein
MGDFLQRYSQIEFPSYRFIPGENPHPTESPLGHSYGKKESDGKIFVPDNWSNNEQYLFGIDLYNNGYWWESHEAWESLWRVAPRDHVSRDFMQGLIKVSGAFLKWYSKNKNGLEYLYTGGMKKLLKVGEEHPVYMGLNIVDYIQKMENHFKPVLEECSWPDPLINYPYIVLTYLEEKIGQRSNGFIMKRKQEVLMIEKQDLRYILRSEYEGYGMISEGYHHS